MTIFNHETVTQERVVQGSRIAYEVCGAPAAQFQESGSGNLCFFWVHGWGQSRNALRPMAESLNYSGWRHILPDLPGFGDSPLPPEQWLTGGTEAYADALAEFLQDWPEPRIWIGHSYGGRIGIQLAARHPGLLSGLVLIASAGLPRRRSFGETLLLKSKVYAFKGLKLFVPEGEAREKLRQRFGSSDYRNAGCLRPLMVQAAREDLSGRAAQLRCPTLLIYGGCDRQTPPDIGERLAGLIPDARLQVFAAADHYSLLGEDRHPVLYQIKRFAHEHIRTGHESSEETKA